MNDKKYTVYKHTSPDGKVYIGCTGSKPEERWNKGYQHNNDLSSAIDKFGWDNFDHAIIASGMNETDAYDLEKELIREYDSSNPKYGYNKSIGGKINSGIKRTDEYRRKMSELKRGEKHNFYGKHHTEESKQKMSESTRGEKHYMYGKHHTEETKRKLSELHKRENLSEETLIKMRNARLGKQLSESTRNKISKSHSKKIICIETNKVYNSVNEAAMDVNIYATNISAVLNKKQRTAGGYHWTYAQ